MTRTMIGLICIGIMFGLINLFPTWVTGNLPEVSTLEIRYVYKTGYFLFKNEFKSQFILVFLMERAKSCGRWRQRFSFLP